MANKNAGDTGSDKKDIRVYFCPSCKSTDVRYSFGLRNLFGVIPKMKCMNCEFSAPSFPISETNKKELSKINKKTKKTSRKKVSKKTVKKSRGKKR